MDPFLPDDRKVAAIRALLPATGAGIHLDVPTAGPLPAETDRALREADDWELRVGRGGPDHEADAALRRAEATGVVAAVLGVGPDEVLLGAGVRGLVTALLAALEPEEAHRRLALVPGLEPATRDAAEAAATALGWTVEPMGDRSTAPGRGVTLAPAVRADDGARVDLAGLSASAHAAGGLLVADLTHAAGATELPVRIGGADAAVLATDLWLLAPAGTAAAWLSSSLVGRVQERARRLVDPPPRRAALGVARSIGWLLMYVGLPWAITRTGRLAARLAQGLAGVPGVTLLGSGAAAGPLLAFRVEGWSAGQVADELGRRIFAITGRTPAGDAVRLGVGAWTTEGEIDRFLAGVRELAAHRPDTLPRLPVLVVLGDG